MSFASDVRRFTTKAEKDTDTVIRYITLSLFAGTVQSTPVGNPSLWAVNKTAANYNSEVSIWNAAQRAVPENLTSAGRLRRGLKVNDSMSLIAPAGYVGGRLKANWQVSQNAPKTGTLDTTDKSGATTIAQIEAGMGGWGSVTYLANNLPYAHAIEFDGHSKQAAAGMVRVNFARITQHVRSAARKTRKA